MPPSVKHLEERLKSRQTETPESIKRRIIKAEKELATSKKFDKIILNDELHHAFVQAEKVVADFLKI